VVAVLEGAIAVAVVRGALVVVGRVSGGGLRPSCPPTVTTVSPPAVPSTLDHAIAGDGPASARPGHRGCRRRVRGLGRARLRDLRGWTLTPAGWCQGCRPPIRGGCWVARMAASAGALWVSLSGERLLRVDPASNRMVATLAMAQLAPAVAADGVWAVCCWSRSNTGHPAGWLMRVDPGDSRWWPESRCLGFPPRSGRQKRGCG
jgi:hypothetical protein